MLGYEFAWREGSKDRHVKLLADSLADSLALVLAGQ
jgi:hypothetical protein